MDLISVKLFSDGDTLHYTLLTSDEHNKPLPSATVGIPHTWTYIYWQAIEAILNLSKHVCIFFISSLSYQILLVTGSWCFKFYFLITFLLIIFKRIYFVYPIGHLSSEVALLLFVCGIESIRNFFGKKGNLTERMLSVVLFLLLTVPVSCGVAYFMWWQTYVLKCDLITSIIMLTFISLQSLFAVFTLFTFER